MTQDYESPALPSLSKNVTFSHLFLGRVPQARDDFYLIISTGKNLFAYDKIIKPSKKQTVKYKALI